MQRDYSIGDAARLSGVTDKQLRNWEKSKYLQDVQRVVSGVRSYRRYSEEQIGQIKRIKGFLDLGYTLPVAAAKAVQNSSKEGELHETRQ